MCGRFTLTADGDTIQAHFDLTQPPTIQARYNIAPSQPVSVITNDARHALTPMQWGLVPPWAKDPKIGYKMINARAETLHEKPSFKNAYKRRRCLIPASGFYEWTTTNNGKQPYYIHLTAEPVFAFAGLWAHWQNQEGDELQTCTIITTTPNSLISDLHHRMAVILPPEQYDDWLDPTERQPDTLAPLLQPYQAAAMDAYPVSIRVNNVKNDLPDLIQPHQPPQQPSLF
jgi:putative SOS response-associated peptidase YedK